MREHRHFECENCGARMTSVFATLTADEISEVSVVKNCNMYDRGETLFAESQYPRGLYCVHSGHVKLVRYGHDGREQIIRFAGAGDTIGYAAMVTGEPYTISAIAVEPSSVCFVPNENIHRYLKENPHLSLRVLQLMSHELQDTERRVVELAQKSVRERVAEALLVLRSTFGTEEDGETLNMPLTREEIADIVGTAPESLIRMLGELKASNVIETVGRRIRVKDIEALKSAANLDS